MRNFLILIGLLCWRLSPAQAILFGMVTDQYGEPLPGANVILKGTDQGRYADAGGFFLFEDLEPGRYTVLGSYVGYETTAYTVDLEERTELLLQLNRIGFSISEVTVYGNWADQRTPVTQTNLDKEDLEANNLGQDVPYILRWTPSVVVSSDAGAGVGYTGLRIRGSDPTRINVTINGIPLNDSESQGVFWVDLPDFISSTQSLQIQRGVGTSTNGAGAFGATINLNTAVVHENAYFELGNSIGSFNTRKHSIQLGSGRLNDKFTFDGRLSKILSDGYIDRASSDLEAFFVSGAYLGDKASLRFNVFSGHEITYQAWNGVPAQYIDDPDLRTFNTAGTEKTGDPHDNEVDDYTQRHYQLHYNQQLGNGLHLNLALHYTEGFGFFEQYKAGQLLEEYNLDPHPAFSTTDLIRRRWLDNDFYGTVFSLNFTNEEGRLTSTLGGAWNHYAGRHFGEVIWARFMSNGEQGHRYYDNDATKRDFNIYGKLNYRLSGPLSAYLDLQYRNVDYEFLGLDNEGKSIDQNDVLHFFNPKFGLFYTLENQSALYAAFGVAKREPNRNDYTESSPTSRPRPERLYNTELGFRHSLTRGNFGVNLYYMDYKDQLVVTGQINDVGEYTRINVPESYRLGIEAEAQLQLQKWYLMANTTLSQNKIKDFVEFIDNWDTWTQDVVPRGNTQLAFSPGFISGAEIGYKPLQTGDQTLTLALLGKYVGKQYIDNSSSESTALAAYNFFDFRLQWVWKRAFFKNIELTFLIQNILNAKYSSNAWTYRYISAGYDARPDDPYARLESGDQYNLTGYYPQAGTNFLLGLKLKF